MEPRSQINLPFSLRAWRVDLMHGRPPAEVVCDFILSHCARLNGGSWLGSPRHPIAMELSGGLNLTHLNLPSSPRTADRLRPLSSREELIRHYYLKGVRLDSHEGLLGWLEGRYPLELRLDQPSPQDMLEVQCEGRRFVTLFLEDGQQFTPVGRHAGAYEFLLHDLEHAEKFFGSTLSGQVAFFRLLRNALEAGLFIKLLQDTRFAAEFDYLMSDMNSHPVHLIKYLKAVVLDTFKRGGGGSRELDELSCKLFALWELPERVRTSAMRMNFPAEEQEIDRMIVSQFFMELNHEVRA